MITLLVIILIAIAMYYFVRMAPMDQPYKNLVSGLVLIGTIVWVAQRCGVFAEHLHFPR